MEFFATAEATLRAEELQRHLRIDTLPAWCASIDRVLSHQGDRGDIYCVWGEFRVHREVIRDGVRFTLPACPNALQWTVTSDGPQHGVGVHCTINRSEHDADFIASIEQFVADWKAGLEAGGERLARGRSAPVGDCGMWFG